MVSAFNKLLAPIARRLRLLVGRGVINLVDDSQPVQRLQITIMAEDTYGAVERFQNYGHTSVPLAGAQHVTVSVGGDPGHQLVIVVEDDRYRPRDLQPGESALYDDLEQRVHLTREGIVVKSGKRATVDAPEINLGGERDDLRALIDERILELLNAHIHPISGKVAGPMETPIIAAAVCTIKVKAE